MFLTASYPRRSVTGLAVSLHWGEAAGEREDCTEGDQKALYRFHVVSLESQR